MDLSDGKGVEHLLNMIINNYWESNLFQSFTGRFIINMPLIDTDDGDSAPCDIGCSRLSG